MFTNSSADGIFGLLKVFGYGQCVQISVLRVWQIAFKAAAGDLAPHMCTVSGPSSSVSKLPATAPGKAVEDSPRSGGSGYPYGRPERNLLAPNFELV